MKMIRRFLRRAHHRGRPSRASRRSRRCDARMATAADATISFDSERVRLMTSARRSRRPKSRGETVAERVPLARCATAGRSARTALAKKYDDARTENQAADRRRVAEYLNAATPYRRRQKRSENTPYCVIRYPSSSWEPSSVQVRVGSVSASAAPRVSIRRRLRGRPAVCGRRRKQRPEEACAAEDHRGTMSLGWLG